jgi:hypothetical protein
MRATVAAVVLGALAGGCFVESRRDYADFYESCQSTSDCRSGADACFVVAWADGRDGRMCSVYCGSDADCPHRGSCFELAGDPSGESICYGRCTSDLDCDSGFTCADATTVDGTVVDAICLPL